MSLTPKEQYSAQLYHDLSQALIKHNFTALELLGICGEVISDKIHASSQREQRLLSALFETFNCEKRNFNRFDVFCLAEAVSLVFTEGSSHSLLQKQNYEAYKNSFLALEQSDQEFLMKKYPNLRISKEI